MKYVNAIAIFRQLKADLIGKDSHRGVSLTYAWLANQFGHFSLGFFPTLILYRFLKVDTDSHARVAFTCSLYIGLAWLVFELFNFLGPLLFKKNTASKLLFVPGKQQQFSPAWANIAFDTFTDVCFFVLGAFAAGEHLYAQTNGWYVLGVTLLVVVYPAYYWYRTKIYLQNAQYPYQFRLSQWDYPIGSAEKQTVLEFLKDTSAYQHLLIFGAVNSGKTGLAVAIATECSFKQKACTYLTAFKLFAFLQPQAPATITLWNWQNAELLVIDDINPGQPVPDDIVTPTLFLQQIDRQPENRQHLISKKVIWVLGYDAPADVQEAQWRQLLMTIGVHQSAIVSIHLPA
ncbi:MAG: hypothetical protein RLY16_601 [Bacteroidota bacterium]